jgi:hypothetical protein
VQSEERNWDLVLCPYQKIADHRFESFYAPGQKWAGLLKYFSETNDWKHYDYIWLPDDDIETDCHSINRMFDQCAIYSVDLAAPALSKNSYYSHFITMQNENFQWRKTSFVEIMFPCISAKFIYSVIRSLILSKSGTGFGLDFLWPALLSYENIMIFDNVTMRHTRPIGGFRSEELSYAAINDMRLITNGLGIQQVYKTFEAMGLDNEIKLSKDNEFKILYDEGFKYITNDHYKFSEFTEKLQSFDKMKYSIDYLYSVIEFFENRLLRSEVSVALKKPALVSSVSQYSRSQDRAIEAQGGNDGIINGHCRFHTDFELNPWWQVDLEACIIINSVVLYNRMDAKNRCNKVALLASNDLDTWTLIAVKLDSIEFGGVDGHPYVFSISPSIKARYIRIQLIDFGYLHLDQIEVFRCVENIDGLRDIFDHAQLLFERSYK